MAVTLSSPLLLSAPAALQTFFFFFSISAAKSEPAATPPPQIQVPQKKIQQVFTAQGHEEKKKIKSTAKHRGTLLYLPYSLLRSSCCGFLAL